MGRIVLGIILGVLVGGSAMADTSRRGPEFTHPTSA